MKQDRGLRTVWSKRGLTSVSHRGLVNVKTLNFPACLSHYLLIHRRTRIGSATTYWAGYRRDTIGWYGEQTNLHTHTDLAPGTLEVPLSNAVALSRRAASNTPPLSPAPISVGAAIWRDVTWDEIEEPPVTLSGCSDEVGIADANNKTVHVISSLVT